MDKRIFYTLIILLATPSMAQAEPVSIALGVSIAMAWTITAAAALAVIGTTVGIVGAVTSSNAQKAQAEYQEEVNLRNAASSRNAAQAKINQQRLQNKFLQGTQLAKLGGMGVTAEGSTLQLLGQTAGQEKYDELVTQYEGDNQAIQFEQKAALNEYSKSLQDLNLGLNVTSLAIKGASQIGGTLLTAGMSAASPAGTGSGSAASSFGSGVGTAQQSFTSGANSAFDNFTH